MNDQLTEKIIASAFKVYNTLGFGFLEKVYENAMRIELSKRGILAIQQSKVTVFYEQEVVGDYQPDLWIANQIIVELKSIHVLTVKHEAQLVNYLTATKTEVGLLLNFGPDGVVVKRKYRFYRLKM